MKYVGVDYYTTPGLRCQVVLACFQLGEPTDAFPCLGSKVVQLFVISRTEQTVAD